MDLDAWEKAGKVTLTTLAGDQLELNFDGAHRINGEVIDYDSWPLYGAPEAQGEVNTGRMRFGSGDDIVDVDFELDTQQDLMPMRVIG